MASQVIRQILDQRYALDLMTYSVITFDKITTLVDANHATSEMIKSIEYTYERQRELGTLTEDQENVQEKLNILKDSFRSIIITLGEERKNLWELGEYDNPHIDLFLKNQFHFESRDIVKRCIATCTDF